MIFKVGDKVRLKDYRKHIDWKYHTGEVATIYDISNKNIYNINIRWDDGGTSSAPADNLILEEITNWRERIEGQK